MMSGKLRRSCELDSQGCLALERILGAFNAPLGEEQTWALCYQTVKCILKEVEGKDAFEPCYKVTELSHIRIHKDGEIHSLTIRPNDVLHREVAESECKIISGLGGVIFKALDFGLHENEECLVSRPLELLVDRMTSAGSVRIPDKKRDRDDISPRRRRAEKHRRRVRRQRFYSGDEEMRNEDESSSSEEDEDSDENGEHADDDSEHPDDEGIERDHDENELSDEFRKRLPSYDQEPDREKRKRKGCLGEGGMIRSKRGLTLRKILEMCETKFATSSQAEAHFKAVCRALVAEALDLSSFLQKISQGTKELRSTTISFDVTDSRLDNLHIDDWARLWVQVIRELRLGVKLKKVDNAHLHPYEFELTPFEMLLDDIRLRRYTLKKIMVNGDLPRRVKKDAHALILDYIRSRPPLRPASQRHVAPPPVRQLSLYEKLMASIKNEHKLKPTVLKTKKITEVESTRIKSEVTSEVPPAQPTRRVIKPNIALRFSVSVDEEEDDDDIDFSPPLTPTEKEPMSMPVFSSNHKEYSEDSGGSEDRRHSLTFGGSAERPTSLFKPKGKKTPQETCPSSAYTENYWNCSQWRSLEYLSLTLEEVVHIRNVLTKAELESVVGNKVLYEDLLKGKICFTCKNVRFSMFRSWRNKCKLCERNVCVNCSTKMKIPTEHYAKIPVYMLSPVPSPPFEEPTSLPFWNLSSSKNVDTSIDSNGSCTASSDPNDTHSTHSTPQEDSFGPPNTRSPKTRQSSWKLRQWESFSTADSRKRPQLMRSNTIHVKEGGGGGRRPSLSPVFDILEAVNGGQKLTGPVAAVCRDCKDLVSHIMDSRSPHSNVAKPTPFPLMPVKEGQDLSMSQTSSSPNAIVANGVGRSPSLVMS